LAATELTPDAKRLWDILRDVKRLLVRRSVLAWERSPETFGEEIAALNDVDETIRNNSARSD
jgi:hypothetical protein